MCDIEPTLFVLNHNLRPFRVRLVTQGRRYGRDRVLVHDQAEPLVEFYDASVTGRGFDPEGQFISRYRISQVKDVVGGLALDFGIPEWWLDDKAILMVQRWMQHLASAELSANDGH